MTQVEVEVGMDVHLILWLVLRARDTHTAHVGVMYTHAWYVYVGVVRTHACWCCITTSRHHARARHTTPSSSSGPPAATRP